MTDVRTGESPAVQGDADPRFAELRDELQRQLDSGEELGASIAVVERGKPVEIGRAHV